ncbi:KR domain-containing protein [Streptacidiphilus sp. 4-A2]|nr:KR domain-containing protein [Streptacidiphilus sp. 4-A2]
MLADLDGGADAYSALIRALASSETQLAVRSGRASAARLAVAEPGNGNSADDDGRRALDGTGTVMVTGGTGLLGGLLARHLVTEYGVRHLLLLSRRGPAAEGAAELHAQLTALGAEVTITACDAADRDALATTPPPSPPNTHSPASSTPQAPRRRHPHLTHPQRLAAVMRPKVDAAWNLHELTRETKPALFILFSSAAGVLGQAGQASYSAANAFLDALATHRHAQGLSGLALAWGLWAEAGGMTRHLDEADLHRLSRTGLSPMPSEQGLKLFDAALDAGRAVLVPARLDTQALRAQSALPPLLRGLIRTQPRQVASTAGELTISQKIVELPPAERAGLCSTWSAARSRRSSAMRNLAGSTPNAASWNSASTPSPRSNCATGSAPTPGSACLPRSSSIIPLRPRSPASWRPRSSPRPKPPRKPGPNPTRRSSTAPSPRSRWPASGKPGWCGPCCNSPNPSTSPLSRPRPRTTAVRWTRWTWTT